jgi:hypothetical protein
VIEEAEVLNILRAWEAANAGAGQRFDWDSARRISQLLPGSGVWAISEDARALFALVDRQVLFLVALSDKGAPSITRRPLRGDRIIVTVEIGAPISTLDGTVRETDWTFRYIDSDSPAEQWQHLTGSVIVDRLGHERTDQREAFARSLAEQAGWTIARRD